MKKFTYIKTGYSKGMYGCSNEYFEFIVIKGTKIGTFRTKGLYGGGYQTAYAYLIENGFEYFPAGAVYGQIKRDDYKGLRFDTEEDVIYFAKKGKYKDNN